MFHDLGPDFWKTTAAFARLLGMAAWAMGGLVVVSQVRKLVGESAPERD
ncbi:hypothetical protein [Zoogloea sp.]|nr:hypothetical protein [uncultured Zoogloea sp.]